MTKQFYSAAILAASMLLASCAGEKKEEAAAVADAPKYRSGVEAFYSMWLSGNMDGIDTLVDAGFVEHTPPPGTTVGPGIEGLKAMMKMGHDMAPDSKFEIINYCESNDMAYVHYNWKGTNTGAMGEGMPATNKAFDINGVDVLKFVNGKCTEHWGYSVESKMMTQLGLMPAPGAPADSMAKTN